MDYETKTPFTIKKMDIQSLHKKYGTGDERYMYRECLGEFLGAMDGKVLNDNVMAGMSESDTIEAVMFGALSTTDTQEVMSPRLRDIRLNASMKALPKLDAEEINMRVGKYNLGQFNGDEQYVSVVGFTTSKKRELIPKLSFARDKGTIYSVSCQRYHQLIGESTPYTIQRAIQVNKMVSGDILLLGLSDSVMLRLLLENDDVDTVTLVEEDLNSVFLAQETFRSEKLTVIGANPYAYITANLDDVNNMTVIGYYGNTSEDSIEYDLGHLSVLKNSIDNLYIILTEMSECRLHSVVENMLWYSILRDHGDQGMNEKWVLALSLDTIALPPSLIEFIVSEYDGVYETVDDAFAELDYDRFTKRILGY